MDSKGKDDGRRWLVTYTVRGRLTALKLASHRLASRLVTELRQDTDVENVSVTETVSSRVPLRAGGGAGDVGDGEDHMIDIAGQLNEQVSYWCREWMAVVRELDEVKGETARMQALLDRAADYLEDLRDEGPPDEGWQSDELRALLNEIATVRGKSTIW
jgi:hypothetical protein